MNKKFDGEVTVESAQLGNKTLTIPKILDKYTKNNSRNGEITTVFQESTPTTVYSKEDDDGISYIFAGVNPNNWVKLGNMYFRIIRFNGNGTIRLIYSGISSPATNGAATRIGTSKFNLNNNNNMYVGLQYTEGEAHGSSVNSNILGDSESLDAATLYGWYNSIIKPEYSSLVDTNAKFCNNRESYY